MDEASIGGWRKKTLGLLCGLVWVAIAVVTLWPLNPMPKNEVNWLQTVNGIHFGRKGIVVSSALFSVERQAESHSCALEIWLSPESEHKVSTILSFYSADNPRQFIVRQYLDGLILVHQSRTENNQLTTGKLDVEHVLHRLRPTLITISASEKGTSVYADGSLVLASPSFRLNQNAFAGRLVIGTSPFFFDPWSGDLRGLAIYGHELTGAQVQQHYKRWNFGVETSDLQSDNPVAIYAFDEHEGNVARNKTGREPDLILAQRFQIPEKPMLQPAWKEFSLTWEYLADVLRNIAGFIPLGIVFYAYFLLGRIPARAALLTVLIGASTSTMIEILQAFIPQRYSGTTDIVTNTLGATLGVMLLRRNVIKMSLTKLYGRLKP